MSTVERGSDPVTYPYKTVEDSAILADVGGPVEGSAILADVYLPIGGSAPTGALVYIHGGCLMYGSRQRPHPVQLEAYRRAGYAIISIDYRLAPETKLPEI